MQANLELVDSGTGHYLKDWYAQGSMRKQFMKRETFISNWLAFYVKSDINFLLNYLIPAFLGFISNLV